MEVYPNEVASHKHMSQSKEYVNERKTINVKIAKLFAKF
jgi:hypothetical protein